VRIVGAPYGLYISFSWRWACDFQVLAGDLSKSAKEKSSRGGRKAAPMAIGFQVLAGGL
jgi:hypothetical protein